MNKHERINRLLVDFALGELSQQQQVNVKTHVARCPQCKSELKRLEALLECTGQIRELSVDTRMCESAKQAVFEAVESKETKPTSRPNVSLERIGRAIMKSSITKLAAAAVTIIAVLIGMHQFSGSSVAWAEVAEKVEKIHTYVFRMRQTETSTPKEEGFEFVTEKEGIMYNSLEYGNKTEFYRNGELTTRSYLLRKENEFIGTCPPAKMYDRRPLSEAEIREMDQMSPREVVKRFMAAEYGSLGFETINGVKVEGIEVDDPKVLKEGPPPIESFVARLWVDLETELPVWLELEFVPVGSSVRTKMVVDQFQWNVELGAGDFEPNIPADYTLETHKSQRAVQQQDMPTPKELVISQMDLPDVSGLTLLGLEDSTPETITQLVGHIEIWKAQDRIMGTWPAYSDVEQQLSEELRAKLAVENLSHEQLMATAVALREEFWEKGGRLSRTSYPYGYAARILLEIAHNENLEDMTVTDELVETMQSIELSFSFKPDSDERVRNMELCARLKRLRSEQFEQIRRELGTGNELTWEDFVRVNDLAILCGWTADFEYGLDAVAWLIEEAERGGWTAYLQPLRNMQRRSIKGEGSMYNILRATQCEFPEEHRYHGLPSFRGPKKRGAKPIHTLESNPVWHGG